MSRAGYFTGLIEKEAVVGFTRGASDATRKSLVATVEAVNAAESEVGAARAALRDLAEELETSGAKTPTSLNKKCIAVTAALRTAFSAVTSRQKKTESLASKHIASDARAAFDALWRRADPAAKWRRPVAPGFTPGNRQPAGEC